MSATQFDASRAGTPPPEIGPLERRHRESAAFRAASDNTRVTPIMVIQTLIIWFYSPENAGKELDEILV